MESLTKKIGILLYAAGLGESLGGNTKL